MDATANPSFTSFLAQRARDGASVAQLADAIVCAWQQIDAALAPVIGQRGVAALYKRSIHLAGAAHAWLAASQGGASPLDLAGLKAVLSRQGSSEAAAGGAALLLAFQTLVTSLIGPALTGQLLGAVWANFFSGAAAQDPSP